jgi:hypothetical protein
LPKIDWAFAAAEVSSRSASRQARAWSDGMVDPLRGCRVSATAVGDDVMRA